MAKGDVTGRAEDVTGPAEDGPAEDGTGPAGDGPGGGRRTPLTGRHLAPVTHEPDQKAPEKSLVFISLPA